jgi:tetratricopeptide (TPR) repeat protein
MNKETVPANQEIYDRVLVSMESLMKDFLVCENIVSHAKNNFQNKTNDVYWLQSVAKMLSVSCKNAPIFESIATELHTRKPSAKSAYYLATYNLNTAKQDKAIEFFSESVKLESDKMTKATTAYTIASILSTTDKEKSKEMVLTAIENNPTNGRYYIFLGNLYANAVSECGTNDLEKNAIYKLASDTVLKAILVEPRLKGTSEELSKSYLQKIITTKANTKSVKIGCWINQTVIL